MSTKWTFVRVVYHETPRGQARRAQVDWRGNADNFPDMFHRRRPIDDCSMPRCLLRVVDAASLRENAPSEDQRGILHAVVVQVHSKQAVHLAKFFDLFQ